MSTPLLPINLERFLSLTSEREQVVAANMANVDTPGYHAKDVSFAETLLRANDGDSGNESGMEDAVMVRDEKGLMERPDGNNVDLDRESMQLAKTQLQYSLGVQLIKYQFHEVLSAINGGGN